MTIMQPKILMLNCKSCDNLFAKIGEVNIGTLLFIYVIFSTLQCSQYVGNDVRTPLQRLGGGYAICWQGKYFACTTCEYDTYLNSDSKHVLFVLLVCIYKFLNPK